MSQDDYEWGVARDKTPTELHRGPMSEADAREWVREWEEDIAPGARPGMFIVICRPVGPWEPAPGIGPEDDERIATMLYQLGLHVGSRETALDKARAVREALTR